MSFGAPTMVPYGFLVLFFVFCPNIVVSDTGALQGLNFKVVGRAGEKGKEKKTKSHVSELRKILI